MRLIWIIILFIGLYLLRRIFYIAHVFLKRNSKDVEIFITFFEDKEVNAKAVEIAVPFYDEKKSFYLGFGLGGLQVGYTPYETIAKVLKKVFSSKYLVQVCLDDLFYPSLNSLNEYYRPKKYTDRIQIGLKERGIELVDGAVLYSQDAIQKDGIEYGISDGMDLFYICSQFDDSKKNTLKAQIEEWQKLDKKEAYFKEKEFLDAEGELFKRFEGWRLVHKDEAFLLYFVNEVFKASLEKVFYVNNLKIPEDFIVNSIEDVFKNIFSFSDKPKPNRIKIYFDDGNLTIFRDQDKIYETYIKKITVVPERSRLKEALSYLYPELIDIKAYSKRKLRKFGIKFFFLFIYMALITFGLGPLLFNVWHVENMILGAVCFFAAPLLGVVSLILSTYYLTLGIFSKKDFVRAGI